MDLRKVNKLETNRLVQRITFIMFLAFTSFVIVNTALADKTYNLSWSATYDDNITYTYELPLISTTYNMDYCGSWTGTATINEDQFGNQTIVGLSSSGSFYIDQNWESVYKECGAIVNFIAENTYTLTNTGIDQIISRMHLIKDLNNDSFFDPFYGLRDQINCFWTTSSSYSGGTCNPDTILPPPYYDEGETEGFQIFGSPGDIPAIDNKGNYKIEKDVPIFVIGPSDDSKWVYAHWNVTIQENQQPPVITVVPDELHQEVFPNTSVNYQVTATDPDGGTVELSIGPLTPAGYNTPDTSVNNSGTSEATGEFSWLTDGNDLGTTHSVTFTATDDEGTSTSVTVNIDVKGIIFIEPEQGASYEFELCEDLDMDIRATGNGSVGDISLELDSSALPSSFVPARDFQWTAGDPVGGHIGWMTGNENDAGNYQIKLTAKAADPNIPPAVRTVEIRLNSIKDTDGDGIADKIDTQPQVWSDNFTYEGTSGEILRGDQNVTIRHCGNFIRASTDPTGGETPAYLFGCNGLYQMMLDSGEHCQFYCGSATIEALVGTIDLKLTAIDGAVATMSIEEGNTVTLDAETFSISAPSTNSQIVIVYVDGREFHIVPGTTYELPDTAYAIVDVDIKPGSDPNCIKVSNKGSVAVGILASATLDVNTIDASTIEIDDDDTPGEGVKCVKSSTGKDVNKDHLPDLVCHFNTSDMESDGLLVDGNTLYITGTLNDGSVIIGSDVIFLAGGPNCF